MSSLRGEPSRLTPRPSQEKEGQGRQLRASATGEHSHERVEGVAEAPLAQTEEAEEGRTVRGVERIELGELGDASIDGRLANERQRLADLPEKRATAQASQNVAVGRELE